MNNPHEFLETADPKQKAFCALALAADLFFRTAMAEREKKSPGPAQAARVLVEEGRSSVIVSIQFDREKMSAALALAPSEFVNVLSSHELALSGPLKAAFADPGALSITDLGKLN